MSNMKWLLAVAVILVCHAPAMAQRVSPHETVSNTFDNARNNRVTVTYGRPYSKEPRGDTIRKIWGTLVPYGKAWRLGADEATILTAQQPLVIGDKTIPAGAYTLYMVPEENGGKLVFSSGLGGWGVPVDEQHDVTRVDLKKEPLEKQLDQLAIAVDKVQAGGGVLKIMWENAQYSVPFTIKK